MGSNCCCSTASLAGIQTLLAAVSGQLEAFNLSGGTGSVVLTPLSLVEFDAVSFSDDSYVTALTDSNNKKFIQITNRSDGDIYVSLDGVDNFVRLNSGDSITLDLAATGSFWDGNISFRRDTINPAAAGIVSITAYY